MPDCQLDCAFKHKNSFAPYSPLLILSPKRHQFLLPLAMHDTKPTRPHVALLASPGMGHVIPVLELAKRIAKHHDFDVTLFVVAAGSSSAESQLVNKAANLNNVNVVVLPPLDISGLIDPTASIVTRILVMMNESLPNLRLAITAMKVPPVALIVDLFGTKAIAVAHELGMLAYAFITSNAWFLAVTLLIPFISKQEVYDHIFQQEPLRIPGCDSVRFEDTLQIFLAKDEKLHEDFACLGLEIPTADGILVNTWQDLEPKSLKALRGGSVEVPIYPIGPLTRMGEPGLECEVLEWLDFQPSESVIYVSFGSGGTLSAKQITELAWGLEKSQQRFIWVVRPPMENDASATYFTVGNKSDGTPDYLPVGFLTRTKKSGLVVPMWAPQTEILAHPSIGGFLSHCGWNSTLESISNGVPMIAWPLYSEQKMNAAILAEKLEVAVRVSMSSQEGVVVRDEIEKSVRKIIEKDNREGNAIRNRVKNLKKSGEIAISKGGSSYTSLSQVARECEIISMQSAKLKARGA